VDEDGSLSVFWFEESKGSSELAFAESPDGGRSWGTEKKLAVPGVRTKWHWAGIQNGTRLVLYEYWSVSPSCEIVQLLNMDNREWKGIRLDKEYAGGCGRSLDPWVLGGNGNLIVIWQERYGGKTSFHLRMAGPPWANWSSPILPVMESTAVRSIASPKIISGGGKKYLTYYEYTPSLGPMRTVVRGDLKIRELLLK
jgi:hypothetical protein